MTNHSANDRLGIASDLLDAARAILWCDPDTLALHPNLERLRTATTELAAIALDASEAATRRGVQQPNREVLVADVVVTSEASSLTPWTDGWAVGFRATRPDGRTEYAYLNPSSGSTDAAEEGLATVFTYAGPHGDPAEDEPVNHLVLLTDEGATQQG